MDLGKDFCSFKDYKHGVDDDLVICSIQAGAEPAKYQYFLLMHHIGISAEHVG